MADQIWQGTVVGTKTGSQVKVKRGGAMVTCEVARDQPVANNDIVLVTRIGSKHYVYARCFTAAPVPKPDTKTDPAPKVKPKLVYDTVNFAPTETRSYRGGKWRTDSMDVWQGNYGGNNTGCVFYGDQVKTLKGATILDCAINVSRVPGGNVSPQQSTMWRMVERKRPSGAPTLNSAEDGPLLGVYEANGDFHLPTYYVTAMANGTAGGIAFESGSAPLMRFTGMGNDSGAFTLTVSYKRLES